MHRGRKNTIIVEIYETVLTMTEKKKKRLKRVVGELSHIIFRNVFILINGIIFVVIALLFVFGDTLAGIFLGCIQVLNIGAGVIQEIRAWAALEKLQLLTALRVERLDDAGNKEIILAEEIRKGDKIFLKNGDQVPCDGVLISSEGMQINNALLTGESDSFPVSSGDALSAGSIVTSGLGIMQTSAVFAESRIARMTEGIKKYAVSTSPIQRSIARIISWTSYILLASIAFVLIRGFILGIAPVQLILNVGALTSMIVPQGLVFAVTLMFAYGAANLYNRNVLLQEVNATEKLGRIKNLCMDKTGTLTENIMSVEEMHTPAGVSQGEAKELMAAYLEGTKETSQTMIAVRKFIAQDKSDLTNIESLPFSSWRQFGIAKINYKGEETAIFVGLLDPFLSHLSESDKLWISELVKTHSNSGKHMLWCVRGNVAGSLENIPKDLKMVSVFVFKSNLREGIKDAIAFFQDRGVSIRIISGDNAKTVQVVSASAGIGNTHALITGPEMASWSREDYLKKAKDYFLFALVKPEQKEKLIESIKQDGFTAMVGDGANDALAIKKADLGIAMFDGAPATRQLAAVVLTNNSFLALPGGVRLADNIIENIEIFSSLFFSQVAIGLFLFLAVSVGGYSYPLTPFNITLINYFTVGLPGLLLSYWVIRPPKQTSEPNSDQFLRKVLPFSVVSAALASIGTVLMFILSSAAEKASVANTSVVLSFIVTGIIFFIISPRVYNKHLTATQGKTLVAFAFAEIVILYAIFHIPILLTFFNVEMPSYQTILKLLIVGVLYGLAQYILANFFLNRKLT